MVAVDRDRIRVDRGHHHVERAALGLRLQPRPDLRLGGGIEHAARQALHQPVVALAEALLGRHFDLEPVAGLLAGQRNRESTRLNSSHYCAYRIPSSARKKNNDNVRSVKSTDDTPSTPT